MEKPTHKPNTEHKPTMIDYDFSRRLQDGDPEARKLWEDTMEAHDLDMGNGRKQSFMFCSICHEPRDCLSGDPCFCTEAVMREWRDRR